MGTGHRTSDNMKLVVVLALTFCLNLVEGNPAAAAMDTKTETKMYMVEVEDKRDNNANTGDELVKPGDDHIMVRNKGIPAAGTNEAEEKWYNNGNTGDELVKLVDDVVPTGQDYKGGLDVLKKLPSIVKGIKGLFGG